MIITSSCIAFFHTPYTCVRTYKTNLHISIWTCLCIATDKTNSHEAMPTPIQPRFLHRTKSESNRKRGLPKIVTRSSQPSCLNWITLPLDHFYFIYYIISSLTEEGCVFVYIYTEISGKCEAKPPAVTVYSKLFYVISWYVCKPGKAQFYAMRNIKFELKGHLSW